MFQNSKSMFDSEGEEGLLWSMIPKSPQHSGGMQPSRSIGRLVCQVEICYFGQEIVEHEDIAGSDVPMND